MKRCLQFGCLLLLLFGCRSQEIKVSKTQGAPRESQSDTYTFLKYTFYSDLKGNLFEKKSVAIDNLNEERRYFFDSSMFLGGYPNTVPLNQIIDIESFKEYEETPFSRDTNHVYYVQATSGGHHRFIVESADPRTFKPIRYRWGKDSKSIFWQTERVIGADLKTFDVSSSDQDSASDKNSFFWSGRKAKPTD